MLPSKRLIRTIFFLSFFITSCLPKEFETSEVVAPTDLLHGQMMKDIMATIKANFAPAKTKFRFKHKDESLALSLEASLRKSGYALTTDPKDLGATALAYHFGEVKKDVFFVNVRIGPTFQVTRLYTKKDDGDSVASGPMLIRR